MGKKNAFLAGMECFGPPLQSRRDRCLGEHVVWGVPNGRDYWVFRAFVGISSVALHIWITTFKGWLGA